ncbi:hypothetical protein MGYG_08294 [Nannizzia gypsea CBS 118893]|uniref:Uncharacterized protein n=1 Tax=Arthroderma gypseum (strain ATCC MYA-4604 / CBS 118893) TaxID=535722 RepID=E4V6A0_ARTGP|nr:hypothetical protein MGYG_08294 [Nannizzia gypsea CBS 118893]EFR05283.1 hypothetical protein MGYG_08294 [Nannizzia gypsea CBS 118893]
MGLPFVFFLFLPSTLSLVLIFGALILMAPKPTVVLRAERPQKVRKSYSAVSTTWQWKNIRSISVNFQHDLQQETHPTELGQRETCFQCRTVAVKHQQATACVLHCSSRLGGTRKSPSSDAKAMARSTSLASQPSPLRLEVNGLLVYPAPLVIPSSALSGLSRKPMESNNAHPQLAPPAMAHSRGQSQNHQELSIT